MSKEKPKAKEQSMEAKMKDLEKSNPEFVKWLREKHGSQKPKGK